MLQNKKMVNEDVLNLLSEGRDGRPERIDSKRYYKALQFNNLLKLAALVIVIIQNSPT